jgi:hypothetical protein
MGGICVAARRRYRTRTGGDDFSRSICGFSARLSVSRAFIRRLNADRFNVGLGRSVRRGALPAIIAKWSSKLLIRLIGLFYISSGNGHHSLRRSIGYCKFKRKSVIFLEHVWCNEIENEVKNTYVPIPRFYQPIDLRGPFNIRVHGYTP